MLQTILKKNGEKMGNFLVKTNACFAVYGRQMHGLLLFDLEVPLVVQGIKLKPGLIEAAHFSKYLK
jgi:hypothetical protein